ncbi:MAG: LmbE family N-acetylglucosaminyl deacetylase [Colwellia sp.]|jgi:LmbE family N-acetylglucosaminyl deacetylase
MLPETSLVPYCVTDVPLGSFLVFAPHPDDEVFSIGGILSHAAMRGQSISIVYMTNGELGGDADTRIAEAHSVCEVLNAQAHFFNIPDSSVKATHALFLRIKELVVDLKPDNVFLPSPQEFHADHRGTAACVWRGLQDAKFSGDTYCYEISRQCECDTLIDISTVMKNKQALCNLYASQLIENNYTDVIKGINKARTYTLPAEIEYAEGLLKINNIHQSPKDYFKNIHENIFFNSLPYESPVISYLVRTKDRPQLLSRCLASLAEQTYHANLDVVVVNDGGVNIDYVCVAFRTHFHRLKLVDIPQSIGRAAAANTALIHAEGVFVNFLDDDDEIDANHTQIFLNQWRRDNSIEILYRGVRVLKANGELMLTYNESFSRGRLMLNNYIPIHAVTFSRKFIDMGCRFDDGLPSMEDWDFWIQLSRFSEFRHIPTITATYHMVGSSAASPHMQSIYDSQSHINTVREKWMPKWTAVEMGQMTTFLQQQNEQRFQQEVAQVCESAERTLSNG